MPVISVTSLDDPRLDVYRDLKRSNLTRWWFIAEGAKAVERLLASDFPVESLLVSERRFEQLFPTAPEHVSPRRSPDRFAERRGRRGNLYLSFHRAQPQDGVPDRPPC